MVGVGFSGERAPVGGAEEVVEVGLDLWVGVRRPAGDGLVHEGDQYLTPRVRPQPAHQRHRHPREAEGIDEREGRRDQLRGLLQAIEDVSEVAVKARTCNVNVHPLGKQMRGLELGDLGFEACHAILLFLDEVKADLRAGRQGLHVRMLQ